MSTPKKPPASRLEQVRVATQFKPGQSGNPKGISKADGEAKALMRGFLAMGSTFEEWRKSYLEKLTEGNPLILKDYADRVDGKPIERVAHSNADGSNLFQPVDLSKVPAETAIVIRDALRKLEPSQGGNEGEGEE